MPNSALAFPPMAHFPCALQDEIDEIGFRGDQEEEEDVFAVADEMRRKKREENAEADAVDDDEVRGQLVADIRSVPGLLLRDWQQISYL